MLTGNQKVMIYGSVAGALLVAVGVGVASAEELPPAPTTPNTAIPGAAVETGPEGDSVGASLPPTTGTTTTPGGGATGGAGAPPDQWRVKITDLQRALKAAGPVYARLLGTSGPAHDGVDGIAGVHTNASLVKWETDHALPATGMTDRATLYTACHVLGVPIQIVGTVGGTHPRYPRPW